MLLNVSLPPELEHRVRKTSPATLKADIAKGLADARAGRVGVVDMAAIKARGRAALQAKASG